MARTTLFVLAFSALVGCSATTTPHATLGLEPTSHDAARITRLERAGSRVLPVATEQRTVRLALSSRDEVGAWSWPDGRIRVSRTLVDLLDDEELAAALAHEVGHLLDGGHIEGLPEALGGAAGAPGTEARADVLGCSVLRTSGVAPEALPRMLRTVAAGIAAGAEGADPQILLQRARAADRICRPAS